MLYQDVQTNCGCETTCCDRRLTPVQDQASGCCSSTAAAAASCGCVSTSSEPASAQTGAKSLDIEFLYLDLNHCDRCQTSEASLAEAIAEVETVLKATGIQVKVQKIHVQNEEQARQLDFVTSPTIRLNGQDIQLDFKESNCGSCSDLAETETACRVWSYQGREYTAPPKAMIIDAILRAVYSRPEVGAPLTGVEQETPENLKRFFAAREKQLTKEL